MKSILMVCLLSAVISSSGMASNDRIFIASVASFDDTNILTDYPGEYWGKSAGQIFLRGGSEEENWLVGHNVRFESREYSGESSCLFVVYLGNGSDLPNDIDIIYRGDDFILSQKAPEQDFRYRLLSLRKYPERNHDTGSNVILEYDSVIDNLVSQVSIDTMIEFLSGLTGETGVWIDGQLDTIATRFSPTDDNDLAAAYLKETLINYGYQTEYHGFYNGGGRHIAIYDENLAWMATSGSRAYRTTNGGASWVFMPLYTYAELWGITNSGPDSVWVTGNYGVIKFSQNGGESFQNQNYSSDIRLFGVDFIDNIEGWIAADSGIILHTTNSGWDWNPQPTSTTSRLYDVCFVDDEYGWSVGDSGVVINTTDGGANWSGQYANTLTRLYGVDFTDRNNGWICGWDGVVRRTMDGGASWQTVDLGNSVDKYHVDFPSPLFGCIVGFNGEIFTTSDGGDNWIEQSSNNMRNFYGVSFADTLNGVACGSRIITRTTDGGITWINESGNHEEAWRNVVATKTGTVHPDEEVIICAHFDNTSEQPYDTATGADDNGSGTAAVIEAARIFAGASFERTVKFCLWTGEEQGIVGSEIYASEAYATGRNIVGVYNFDMIGYDGDGDGVIELHCGTESPSIALGDLFMTVINDYNITLNPDQITFGSTDRSDHASFWDYNYPAILGIEDFTNDFNPYYHTTNDLIPILNQFYYREYSKAGIGAVATLAVPDSTMSSIIDPDAVPSGFALRGNYPNPFNVSTTISFALASRSDVTLAVYDVLGRKVAQLVDGQLNTGNHRIVWDARDMSSGVYFYRLSVNGRENAGRMTLLK